MKSQVISLKRRISLVVLTIVMALSAVFGAIFLRGILGDTAQTANADEFESYTVGENDCSTGYLGAFSTRYELTSGNKATFSFTVYSTKTNNWNYWVACVASANNINPDIIALRADNYDNIQKANTGIASNFNWDTFKTDMHGATVSVNFAHFGDNIKVRADITSSGKLFYEEFSKSVSGGVYVFLTVDNSYLNISNEEVLTNNISLKPTVGKTDNTTDYNASQRDNQSDNLLLKPGQKAVFEFVNYSSKGAAAYNWHACAGTTKYNYPDAVIFGANKYDRSMSTSNGVTSSDNYNPSSDSFLNEMDGSNVVVTFTYVGTSLTIRADITSSTGTQYWEQLTKTNLSGNKYVFLTVEKSHLIVKKAYLGIAVEYSKYDTLQHSHNTSSYSGDGIETVATKENHTMLNGVCSVCGYTYEFKANVGNTNNTTAYRGDTSEQFALTAGETAVFNFKNYSDKVNNWDNWIAQVKNANNQDQVLLRADNYEIVQRSNNGISSNFNWDTFKDEMDGSDVVLSFTYTGSAVTIRADMTATTETKRFEEFTKSISGDFINVALTVEKAHLAIDNIEVFEDNTDMDYHSDNSKHWKNSTVYSSSGIAVSAKESHDGSPCSVCGYEGAIEHTYGAWTPDDATTHSRTCLDEDCDETETANHTFGAWSEKDSTYHSRTCSVCGYEETAAHTYDEYIYDSNSHWQICSVCNYNNEAEHIFTDGECVCGLEEDVMLVGTSDFSTGILGDYSDKFALTSGQVAVFTFKNYSSGTTNWDNWLACVGSAVGTPADLIVLRADSYEEKQGDGDGIDHNYADYSWWDYFATDMAASDVVVSFKYTGSAVTIRADMTANGHNRYEEFTKSELSGTIYVSLSVRFSYLAISSVVVKDVCISDGVLTHTRNTVTYSATDEVNGTEAAVHTLNENTHEGVCTDCGYTFKTTVGTRTTVDDVETYANSFFGDKSGILPLESGKVAVFKFNNYSQKTVNWANWMVGVVNNDYILNSVPTNELIVLRADWYEQKIGNGDSIIHNYDSALFMNEMHESSVVVNISYIDGAVTIRADITLKDGSTATRFEKFTKTGVTDDVVYVFISGFESYQEITSAKVYSEYKYVNYSTNNGVSIPKDYVVAAEDGNYYYPPIFPSLSKVGYDFVNWTLNKSASVISVNGNMSNGDRTIVANWTATVYTITYNLTAGTNGEGNPATYTIESEAITLTAPTKPGYTFTGWTGSNGEEANTEVSIAAGSTGNKEYTANWTAIEYSISFTLNGGEATNPASYTIETATFTLTNPTKTGYTFAGWTGSNSEEPQTEVTIEVGSTGDKSYTANWTATQYTITYNLAVGTNGEGNPATYTIESEAITLTAPTKPGYTFTGWTGSNGEEANTEVSIAAGSTGNKEYTANWVVEEGKESLKITEWNLLLSDRIGIRYHLNFASAEEAARYTLTFKINERTVTVSGSSGVANNYWYVFYINSLEMGDNATLSVYEGETEVIRHNAKSANAYFEQINGYTEEQRTAAGLSDKAVDLVNSLNDLGYYMQKANLTDGATHTDMPSEGVSSLSINDMYDEETTVVNHIISELSEEKFTKDHQEGVKASAISFTLSDQCVVNFRVTLEKGYEITATDNGSTYEKIDEENNIYVVKSQRIAPTNLAADQTIQITVSNGVNTSVTTLTASPMTYVRLALKSGSISDDIKLTLVAYYNYYNAAVTYQASVA